MKESLMVTEAGIGGIYCQLLQYKWAAADFCPKPIYFDARISNN